MNKLRLYLDTTIWNFAFSDQVPRYNQVTLELVRQIRWGRFEIYSSSAVDLEISRASDPRRSQVFGLIEELQPKMLEITPEVRALAARYLKQKALPAKSEADALHVACATLAGMDVLVSWNFDHLANVGRMRRLLAVNVQNGFHKELLITSPLEVVGDVSPENA